MHRQWGNAKPAGNRTAYPLPTAGWTGLHYNWVLQKRRSMFRKFPKKSHFEIRHYALPCPARGRNRKLLTWVHNYIVSQKVDHPNGGDNLIYTNISCLEQWSVSGIVTQQVMNISEVLTVSEFSQRELIYLDLYITIDFSVHVLSAFTDWFLCKYFSLKRMSTFLSSHNAFYDAGNKFLFDFIFFLNSTYNLLLLRKDRKIHSDKL